MPNISELTLKMQGNFISSPLNYTGGKYRLLPQIMPLFPQDISTAVDLFCGGANVGINIKANNIILNDSLTQLTQIYQTLQKQSLQKIFEEIWDIIATFELSNSAKMGYEFYQCNSQNGLSSFNKDKFLQLRNRYNIHKMLWIYLYSLFSPSTIKFVSMQEVILICHVAKEILIQTCKKNSNIL